MKSIRFCARFTLGIAFPALFSLSITGQTIAVRDQLSQAFRKFELARIAPVAGSGINGTGKVLRFLVNGEPIELSVSENDLRAPGYRAEATGPVGRYEIEDPPVTTYKGVVRGRPDSEVRLTIDGAKIEGFYRFGNDHFFIEPAGKYSKGASQDQSVIYKAEDSLIDNSFMCEADVPTRIKMGDKMVEGQSLPTLNALRRFDIATDADFEYVNIFGSAAAANSEILSILNMVEGTYISQINLRIRVTYQNAWTSPDPFAGANSSAVLTNFLNYWNVNFPVPNYLRNAAHLFSGKSNVQSQGIAYLGVICQNPNFSYGLSGYVSWAPGKYLVPAHEFGHNLGAQHAEAAQGCGNTLMNAQLTGSTPLSFCSYSQSQINGYISSSGFCLQSVTSKRFDFDGDNRADIAVYRPTEGNWYVRQSNGGYAVLNFGLNGDKPVTADYDADGRSDAAVFRNGVWWRLKSANNTIDGVQFGLAGDIPVPANFDTDGIADIAVFRPSTGEWYWIGSADQSFNTITFGLNGDIPMPADYDGDGRADVNVFRPSTGTWYRLNTSNFAFTVINYGLPGDKPLLGNFDGDSRADVAVWRPSTAEWFLIRSSDGAFRQYSFGIAGDVPATGDFDGDGKTDISLYRPSEGTWYRLNSSDWQFIIVQFGLPGDTPVPSYYLQ